MWLSTRRRRREEVSGPSALNMWLPGGEVVVLPICDSFNFTSSRGMIGDLRIIKKKKKSRS